MCGLERKKDLKDGNRKKWNENRSDHLDEARVRKWEKERNPN